MLFCRRNTRELHRSFVLPRTRASPPPRCRILQRDSAAADVALLRLQRVRARAGSPLPVDVQVRRQAQLAVLLWIPVVRMRAADLHGRVLCHMARHARNTRRRRPPAAIERLRASSTMILYQLLKYIKTLFCTFITDKRRRRDA